MALTLRILGSCDVGVISDFQFYPGEDATFKAQLVDLVTNCPVNIPSGSTKTLTFIGTPNDVVIDDADITVSSETPSIFSTVLDETQTEQIVSGSVTFEYVDGSITKYAVLQSATKRLNNPVI